MKQKSQTSVLFVCLGNICRSPMAEGVFARLVDAEGLLGHFEIDSCGTGHWHCGELAHAETRRVLEEAGALHFLTGKSARQLTEADFHRFQYILAMDHSNLKDIRHMYQNLERPPEQEPFIALLRDYDPFDPGGEVPDPYYDTERGFDNVYMIIERALTSFLSSLPKSGS